MAKIAVLIETKDQEIKKANLGVLTAAQGKNNEVYALVIDGNAEKYQATLQEYGVSKIVSVTAAGGKLEKYHPVLYAKSVLATMENFGISTLVALTGSLGKDLLPRVAASLKSPLITDCMGINMEENTVKKSHFSGKVYATIRWKGESVVLGVRPNAIEAIPSPVESELLSLEASLEEDGRMVLKEVLQKEKAGAIELTEAERIVSGGRPMANAENFKILFECASHIGAAVGASRAAVDSGYAPHDMQVGQTGKTVSPKLYIACGMSGSVQHFAGMKSSKVIVGINTDRNAPIFSKCDYGIVADLFEAVPIMTEIFQSMKK